MANNFNGVGGVPVTPSTPPTPSHPASSQVGQDPRIRHLVQQAGSQAGNLPGSSSAHPIQEGHNIISDISRPFSTPLFSGKLHVTFLPNQFSCIPQVFSA